MLIKCVQYCFPRSQPFRSRRILAACQSCLVQWYGRWAKGSWSRFLVNLRNESRLNSNILKRKRRWLFSLNVYRSKKYRLLTLDEKESFYCLENEIAGHEYKIVNRWGLLNQAYDWRLSKNRRIHAQNYWNALSLIRKRSKDKSRKPEGKRGPWIKDHLSSSSPKIKLGPERKGVEKIHNRLRRKNNFTQGSKCDKTSSKWGCWNS